MTSNSALLEVMKDRDDTRSTFMTSQLPVEKRHDYRGDLTVADAIRDRLLHRAHRIVLEPSQALPKDIRRPFHSASATTARYIDHIQPTQVIEAMRGRIWTP